ncbi:hypothetical protein GW17_00019125 [Ensete ventricosum]|nr:hypothetical protein GW17_00019125 [Ensete ventricosum]
MYSIVSLAAASSASPTSAWTGTPGSCSRARRSRSASSGRRWTSRTCGGRWPSCATCLGAPAL